MKFPPKMNPSLVVSKESNRPLLQNVLIQDGLAVATDGKRLVAVVITPDPENDPPSQLVPAKAVAKACGRRQEAFAGQLKLTKDKAIVESLTEKTSFVCKYEASKFPRYFKTVPPNPVRPLVLVLDAGLLAGLAKAMGNDRVALHIDLDKPEAPMLVTNPYSPLAAGVLCPCRLLTPIAVNQALAIIRSLI